MAKRPVGAIRASDISRTLEFVVDVNAHASGDLLAQPLQLVDVSFGDHYGQITTLQTVTALEYEGDQGQPFTAIFHKVNPVSCGVLNAAPTITDAKMESCVGFARVTTWEDTGTSQAACNAAFGIEMETDAVGDLYVWLLSKGTATYAGGKLRVTFNFYRS